MAKRLLGLSVMVGFLLSLHAQWQPDERLTNNSREDWICANNAKAVAADNMGNVHIVWFAYLGDYSQIFYKKYSGSAWEPELQLTENSVGGSSPCVTVGGSGNVHVTWTDFNGIIWYKRYSNGTWGSNEQVSTTTWNSDYQPSIAADNMDNVSIVYQSARSAFVQIYCRRKVGTTWQAEERVSINSNFSWSPSVAIDRAGNTHVVWYEYDFYSHQIYYRKMVGSIWQAEQQLTDDQGLYPSLACDSLNNVHLVFEGISDIRYMKWSTGSWSPSVIISRPEKAGPSIACEPSGDCHVVYIEVAVIPIPILYRKNQGGTWQTETWLTSDFQPSVAFGNNNIHVVWVGYRDGNAEIYYKKYQGLSIAETKQPFPITYSLEAVRPNPTSGPVEIRYAAATNTQAKIKIYDVTGKLVKFFNLTNDRLPFDKVVWDGKDNTGKSIPNGLYFIRLETSNYSATRKLVLTR